MNSKFCSCGCHAPKKSKKEQIRKLKEEKQRLTYQIVGTGIILKKILGEEKFDEVNEKAKEYYLDLEKCTCQRCEDAAIEAANE